MKKKIRVCGLILENNKRKILFQLRDNKPSIAYPNCWGTFGGHIEDGETPEETIKREIKEELDYDLKDFKLYNIYFFKDYKVYMFRKVDKKIKLSDLKILEGQKGKFLTLKQIKNKKCAFNDKKIAEDYFKKFKT